ncbi:uncharacterized protein TNCV_5015131 [Trichonephila clavipes]|nr:uncharacterized protein TNCV_5015131 [Trichonephila clavipes]
MQSAKKFACSLELCQETSILLQPLCPLDYTHLDINLELHVKALQREMSPELKAIGSETIDNRFPTSEWLHVFTDGSIQDRYHDIGEPVSTVNLFNFYLPLGIFTTAFDDEIEAIIVAIEKLSLRSSIFNKAVNLSDSKSTLQALYPNYPQRILKCKSFLKYFPHKMSFQWIPAHCDIAGNEHADFLVRKEPV